jgi:hypothetical protein
MQRIYSKIHDPVVVAAEQRPLAPRTEFNRIRDSNRRPAMPGWQGKQKEESILGSASRISVVGTLPCDYGNNAVLYPFART